MLLIPLYYRPFWTTFVQARCVAGFLFPCRDMLKSLICIISPFTLYNGGKPISDEGSTRASSVESLMTKSVHVPIKERLLRNSGGGRISQMGSNYSMRERSATESIHSREGSRKSRDSGLRPLTPGKLFLRFKIFLGFQFNKGHKILLGDITPAHGRNNRSHSVVSSLMFCKTIRKFRHCP